MRPAGTCHPGRSRELIAETSWVPGAFTQELTTSSLYGENAPNVTPPAALPRAGEGERLTLIEGGGSTPAARLGDPGERARLVVAGDDAGGDQLQVLLRLEARDRLSGGASFFVFFFIESSLKSVGSR